MKATLPIEQLDIWYARQERDKGMKRAIDHADKVIDNWGEKVYALLKEFLRTNKGNFMAEDFRLSVEDKIDAPPHNRAFGGIFMRAAKAGLIERVTYAPVKNWKAHRANASVWRKS